MPAKELVKQDRLLRSHAHALAIHGIEAADCVSDRQQPTRKRFDLLEMAPYARRETEAGDFAYALGAFDRIVDCRGPQLLSIGKETIAISRRLVRVSSAKRQDPAVALQRQHQTTAAALGCQGKCPNTLPVNRHAGWDSESRCGIPDIDLDDRLLSLRSPDRLQQSEGEVATPRSINDKICSETLALAGAVFEFHCGDGRPTRRCLKLLNAATRATAILAYCATRCRTASSINGLDME